MLRNGKTKDSKEYATQADFCRVFESDMQPLYVLALLLTGNHEGAQQCFVSGIEDAAKGNAVFKQWARSWARRAIIKKAIQIVSPASFSPSTFQEVRQEIADELEGSPILSAISLLEPLPRFAYVMSVLEDYSNREVSLLLSCTMEAVTEARSTALKQLALNQKSTEPDHKNYVLAAAHPMPLTA